ncbi:putative reverse transcriptase domain-containing protein [Tanacetum coccineum]
MIFEEPVSDSQYAVSNEKDTAYQCMYFTKLPQRFKDQYAVSRRNLYAVVHDPLSNRKKGTETSDGIAGIQAQLDGLRKEVKKVNEKVYAAQVECEATAPGYYQKFNGNPPYHERRQSLEESVRKFMTESAKRHEENSNLFREIRAATNSAIRNQGASIKALEIQIRQISKVLQERGSGSLPSSTETNPHDHVKSIATVAAETYPIRPDLGASVSVMPYSTYLTLEIGGLVPTKLIVELADKTVKRPKGIAKNVLIGIDKFTFSVDFVVLDMPEDIKTPLILGRPFLRVYALSLDKRMELDLEARLMGEALMINRSHDPNYQDFLELNDLNEPLELRHDQVVNLGPIVEEGEVIDAPIVEITKARNYNHGINNYPSFCDHDRKIHIDRRYNLRFSCMIDKMEFKGKNVVGAFINVPIFVGTFYVVVDFAVMENMDAYRDKEMGDVIVGKEFCNKIGVDAKRFEGMITIFNGNDGVTYQMARSHPRFKRHSNEQCNKIKPIMKVSEHDKLEGISHPYQKLKKLYKGVLNLGPEYLKNDEVKEWLTRGHMSVHEME